MSRERETPGSIAAAVVLLLALPVPLALLRGWALATLWAWFVVPLGTQVITAPTAFGLGLLWSLFENARPKSGEDERSWKGIVRGAFSGLANSLLAVCIGWCVRRWWL